ncbi:MAG TPA: neutral zinc metallopeptidase [Geminicoccaceae bacterium]|nr:neutral zinc metallopeptidase [Geminicoccaceae bacterium]
MRWRLGRRSQNVEDRRGMGTPVGMRFPGRVRMPGGLGRGGGGAARGGGIGIVGLLILLAIGWFLGIDPSYLLQDSSTGVPYQEAPPAGAPPEGDEQAQFVSAVLADTEDTWQQLFGQMGDDYREPTLVLFSGAVDSACGFAQAAMGPFYCPGDQKVYIDLAFFDELHRRFAAPGDFAQAYVIAHEVGHHVQNLLGVTSEVQATRQQAGEADANALSVMLELQADCFAGVWGHHADRSRNLLEEGDLEEGLTAAAAIGDDRLQRRSQGYVVPDAFTHGSSEQRVRWFRQGLTSGDPNACNTFEAERL